MMSAMKPGDLINTTVIIVEWINMYDYDIEYINGEPVDVRRSEIDMNVSVGIVLWTGDDSECDVHVRASNVEQALELARKIRTDGSPRIYCDEDGNEIPESTIAILMG